MNIPASIKRFFNFGDGEIPENMPSGCVYAGAKTKTAFEDFPWETKTLGDKAKPTPNHRPNLDYFHVFVSAAEVAHLILSENNPRPGHVTDEDIAVKEYSLANPFEPAKKKQEGRKPGRKSNAEIAAIEAGLAVAIPPPKKRPAKKKEPEPKPPEIPLHRHTIIREERPRVLHYVKFPFGGILKSPEDDTIPPEERQIDVPEAIHSFAEVLSPYEIEREGGVHWFVLKDRLPKLYGKSVPLWITILDYDPRDPNARPEPQTTPPQ